MAISENAHTIVSDLEMILPFVLKNRRDRWSELFQKAKGRKKLLATLWNGNDFDRSLMVKVPPEERTARGILSNLKKLGAPETCHLISARPALDGKNLDLHLAVETVFELAPGTIIACVPGRLAYYENDDKNGNYIIVARPREPLRHTSEIG